MSERRVAQLSRMLHRTKEDPERFRLARKIAQTVSRPKYRDGLIYRALAGDIVDELSSSKPTGIIKLSSLSGLVTKYREVHWADLATTLEQDRSGPVPYKFIHLARLIDQAYQRRMFPDHAAHTKPFQVVHLNTYQKVPLYSGTRSHGPTLPVEALSVLHCGSILPIQIAPLVSVRRLVNL